MTDREIVSPALQDEDQQFDLSLRPQTLAEFVGAPFLDEKFDAGVHLVLALAIAVEKPQGSSGEIAQLIRR